MPQEKIKIARRTTLIGCVSNLVLTAFKFVAGFLGHSGAMIADAVHSLSDLFTDIIVLVFMRLSNRPVDMSQSKGPGKIESLVNTIIAVTLFCLGVGIFFHGAGDIVTCIRGGRLQRPGMIALWAAIISIVCKEILYQYTIRVGRRSNSPVLIANAWHHRSDAISSYITTAGIGGAIFLGQAWHVLDPIAAVVVSAFIIKVAFDIIRPSVSEIIDQSLPIELQHEILQAAKDYNGVIELHNLSTRRVGHTNVIDLYVRMPGEMSVTVASDILSRIEHRLHSFLGADAILNIHIEPLVAADEMA